ncbi:MAG TPA: YkgJ family cysteine cluster protein [Syntrophales bacterium]|nr:YkgJ family cysteine cluster protein [Syntrophales bacterium]HQN78991.1 YkgJ family cysteine cluster protein [Syntrophales bacterium]HQQ28383.1 YkgJ family cysteine cluster protein [Syntrophales bacterium]
MNRVNPCLSCGACCALYRASFYWAEGDDRVEGGVPVELTDQMDPFRRVMKGTTGSHPRCIALAGEIGRDVSCVIYERRPSICKDYLPSWLDGKPNERCDKARIAWGLLPLTPDSWLSPGEYPRAA